MQNKTVAQQVNIAAAQKNIPLSVFIELTHRCNLQCYYCYQKSYTPAAEMSFSQWERVVKELAGMESLYITFSGGEPFLRPDFIDIVSCARKHDFAVSIITNGILITEPIVKKLEELGILDIGISLHAANENLHDRLTTMQGSFRLALNAIRLCVKAGIKVLIKHSVSNANFGEYEELKRLAESEGCAFECDSMILPMNKGETSPYALNHEQHFIFLKDMYMPSLINCISNKDASNLHCDAGRSLCGISPGGEVFPCIILPISLGNLQKTSFKTIWFGEKSAEFRKQEEKIEEACKKCSQNIMCSRCHAIAFFETKKWAGKSDSLCARTDALAALART